MTAKSGRATITLAGAGGEADRWTAALRGIEGVDVVRLDGASEDELLESLSRAGVDAVAFVTPIADLAGAIKRSVMARRHVFIAGPVALSSKQLLAIDDLSRRRERAIIFDALPLSTRTWPSCGR